jgi:crossover junction endodeoxyribonuclease RusA
VGIWLERAFASRKHLSQIREIKPEAKMIELPFPPAILNPNTKKHWAVKGRAIKKYRAECCLLAKKIRPIIKNKLDLVIVFFPPDKRKRDEDNMIAAFKAGRDGLADAWGVDDNIFKCTYMFLEPVKHGKVLVQL